MPQPVELGEGTERVSPGHEGPQPDLESAGKGTVLVLGDRDGMTGRGLETAGQFLGFLVVHGGSDLDEEFFAQLLPESLDLSFQNVLGEEG